LPKPVDINRWNIDFPPHIEFLEQSESLFGMGIVDQDGQVYSSWPDECGVELLDMIRCQENDPFLP
jgi:hypothetical protein